MTALEQFLDCDNTNVDFLIKRYNFNYDAGGGCINSLQPAQRGISIKGFWKDIWRLSHTKKLAPHFNSADEITNWDINVHLARNARAGEQFCYLKLHVQKQIIVPQGPVVRRPISAG